MKFTSRLGALALPIAAAMLLPGVAAALPLDGPLISTTCSYSQLVGALAVEAPDLADRLAQNPDAQAKLQKFVALSVDQRKQAIRVVLARNPGWENAIDEKRNTPQGQDKMAMLARIADTCHDYP
jgi:hemophore-related protein